MPYSATKVANEFLRLARENAPARLLTPLQVMKLVYIAHGWSLALLGRPLISDEIEAWKYGPVVPDLYQKIKRFGSGAITEDISEGIWAIAPDIAGDEKSLIQSVYEKYGRFNGVQLSNLTHMPDTPWAEYYRPNAYGVDIPNEAIAAHYRQLSKQRGGQ